MQRSPPVGGFPLERVGGIRATAGGVSLANGEGRGYSRIERLGRIFPVMSPDAPSCRKPALQRIPLASAFLILTLVAGAGSVEAQEIVGRVIDSENGAPIGLAGVFVLDREREVVVASASDTAGFYSVQTPGTGEYILIVQRLGYFENETPLFAVEEGGQYGVDIEMRPEPFRLDPLEVTVRNEELERYLTLEMGTNPNSVFGYRVFQGLLLEEAKLGAADNTQVLRRLFIPVSHGRTVCVGELGLGMPDRKTGYIDPAPRCGALFVNDVRCPAEHMETIDMAAIGVVVRLGGAVRLYTRDFDWTFRSRSGRIPC